MHADDPAGTMEERVLRALTGCRRRWAGHTHKGTATMLARLDSVVRDVTLDSGVDSHPSLVRWHDGLGEWVARPKEGLQMLRGPKRTVLRALSDVRFADGEALLKTGHPERRMGAIYLAGYGIECALKARICADRGDSYLDPQFFHHDLRRLAEATTVWGRIQSSQQRLETLTYLQGMWDVSMRYAQHPYSPAEVRRFIQRGREFVRWL